MKKLPIDDLARSAAQLSLSVKPASAPAWPVKPTQAQAEAAVRTLLAWAGEDPDREGLRETPKRVAEAYLEYFAGYAQDPVALLSESLVDDVSGYDDIVMLKDIPVLSHCEHHIAPFMGRAFVAYVPGRRVTGLSRLARVVDALARRLQTQEALTAEIADAIEKGLEPRGVAVLIEAEHQCIAARGLRQQGMPAVTTRFTGTFADQPAMQDRFLRLAGQGPHR